MFLHTRLLVFGFKVLCVCSEGIYYKTFNTFSSLQYITVDYEYNVV